MVCYIYGYLEFIYDNGKKWVLESCFVVDEWRVLDNCYFIEIVF